ncbi:MAG: cation:proton antiporter [Eubacteriales bacterium]|jgi:Kef-type K+ transport system membrane component KefB
MLDGLYEKLSESSVATVIISIAIMLFLGFAATRITKLLRLPNVTAYILTGIAIGPFCLDIIPDKVINGMDFIADIALAFIAFSVGEFFRLSKLKKNGLKVSVISLFDALFSAVLVFVLTYFILNLSFALSIMLSALACTTAPSSTVMTIRQTGAKGDFVDTLLQVVAIDDLLSLLAFGISMSVALSSTGGHSVTIKTILQPVLINGGVLIIGGLFGFFMKALMPKKRSTDNRLIISISLLFAFCGICAILGVSPLLGCISMGTVYINITNDEKLFKQLNYFSPPILLLFFVRSGMRFKLDALTGNTVSAGAVPLLVIGILYAVVRLGGKYAGAFTGSAIVKKDKATRKYLGLALVPQAGFAIGLAELGARTLGAGLGEDLLTIILTAGIIYEIIGPVCAKVALYLAKAYPQSIEEVTSVSEVTETGKQKTPVEVLIERIQEIQKELPQKHISEEEQAFNDAAEEQYDVTGFVHFHRFSRKR